jgi:regulatory protein YycI of two-component signal transduction system YycFG
MLNREEYQLLVEIDKGLNMITVNGRNTILLGKCIDSLEQFLEIKKNEILQYEQSMAQQSQSIEETKNPIKEE